MRPPPTAPPVRNVTRRGRLGASARGDIGRQGREIKRASRSADDRRGLPVEKLSRQRLVARRPGVDLRGQGIGALHSRTCGNPLEPGLYLAQENPRGPGPAARTARSKDRSPCRRSSHRRRRKADPRGACSAPRRAGSSPWYSARPDNRASPAHRGENDGSGRPWGRGRRPARTAIRASPPARAGRTTATFPSSRRGRAGSRRIRGRRPARRCARGGIDNGGDPVARRDRQERGLELFAPADSHGPERVGELGLLEKDHDLVPVGGGPISGSIIGILAHYEPVSP